MSKLVLIRHGESICHNKEVFTCGMDIPLSSNGIVDAIKAGARISELKFDIVITSGKIRAIETAMIALTQNENEKTPMLFNTDETITNWIETNDKLMQKSIIPVFSHNALDIQCELQVIKYFEQIDKKSNLQWCYDYNKPVQNNKCIKNAASKSIPFLENTIIPLLKKGKNIIISAHINSLSPIISYIEKQNEVALLNIHTERPICYEYIEEKLVRK